METNTQQNIIAHGTKIVGDITSQGPFRIDGTVDGNVKTSDAMVQEVIFYFPIVQLEDKASCPQAPFASRPEADDHLTKDFEIKHPTTLKGVGDDAAVLGKDDPLTVVSTDLLIEAAAATHRHHPFH